jgi:nucleoid DNA-binding protein
MTKAELIEKIARSRDLPADLSKKDIALVIGIAFDEIKGYFARAKVTRSSSPRFTVPHFGTFTKKRRSARMGVNPRTLEPMKIEAFTTLDFKASKELRDALNHGTRTATAEKAEPRVASRRTGEKGRARRPLTPREDADLLDEKLPAAPMQRVRSTVTSRRRGTG